jgi:hypothetical protein
LSEYRIIIPSRKRLKAIQRSGNELFPTSTIVVAESEKDNYATVIHESRIVCHPNLVGYTAIFNWCQEAFNEPCLFFVDDDIRRVHTTFSKPTTLDAEAIQTIIENSIQNITDLNMSVCCFSRTANWTVIDPWNKPIVPVQFPTVAFGIRGSARYRKSDVSLLGRADMDWGLTTLCQDRAVYADVRYFFNNGAIFGGEGGNVGLFDEEHRNTITKKIQDKWGKHVPQENIGYQKNRSVVAMRIKVNRYNKTAVK